LEVLSYIFVGVYVIKPLLGLGYRRTLIFEPTIGMRRDLGSIDNITI
jgi:hypothetical protein